MPFDVFPQVQIHVLEIIMKFHVSKNDSLWRRSVFSAQWFLFTHTIYSLLSTHIHYKFRDTWYWYIWTPQNGSYPDRIERLFCGISNDTNYNG